MKKVKRKKILNKSSKGKIFNEKRRFISEFTPWNSLISEEILIV